MNKLLRIDNVDQIKFEYNNNQNSFLCKKYDCCNETLRKFLRKNNIERKKKAQYTENEDFFHDIDSEEKAYYLGFICADGSINKNRISITLNTKDIDILFKFKSLLKTTAPVNSHIYSDKRNSTIIHTTSIQIYSKKMISDLSVLGVNKNKSKQLRLPSINENLIRHFLRGLFDGDGHISGQCSLISTYECLDDIIVFLKIFNIKVNNYREIINKEKNVYKIYFGKDRIKFLNLLYSNSNVYLERKYNAYLNESKKHDNQIINTTTYHSILLINENIIIDGTKNCADYLNINQWTFMKNFKKGNYINKYKKFEKIIIKTKRNGEKIINRIKLK